MFRRLIAASALSVIVTAATPVHGASLPPLPSRLTYRFEHGIVTNPRGVHLEMMIHTEDPFVAANNGTYHVVFDAKMAQYVLTVSAGAAELSTAFSTISTQVNGSSILNAIPPAYDPATKKQNVYLLYISRNGICQCAGLPPLIYSIAGNVPHRVYLGDLFTYLHPFLPDGAPRAHATWKARLQLGLTPKHLQSFVSTSTLTLKGSAWSVVTHLASAIHLSEPSAQWLKEWGSGWPSPLPYSGPVTVSGSFGIDSVLTAGQNDGIDVAPVGATSKPDQPGSIKTSHCAACTGYTMPLHGVETLHLLYTQAGHELQKIDVQATLDVHAVLST